MCMRGVRTSPTQHVIHQKSAIHAKQCAQVNSQFYHRGHVAPPLGQCPAHAVPVNVPAGGQFTQIRRSLALNVWHDTPKLTPTACHSAPLHQNCCALVAAALQRHRGLRCAGIVRVRGAVPGMLCACFPQYRRPCVMSTAASNTCSVLGS
jgi:hypothetical protein